MENKSLPGVSCEIVEDLLPSYTDGITSDTSNQLIAEHLEDCENCRTKLERMQNPIDDNPEQPTTFTEARSDANKQGVDFLRKIRCYTFIKICVTLVATIMLCFGMFYVISDIQHPFQPRVGNIYRLSDGSLYFELVVSGRQAGVDAIFYSDDISTDGKRYDVQLGYSWSNLWFNNSGQSAKTYCFIRNFSDNQTLPKVTSIYYSFGNTDVVIWEQRQEIPDAPVALESEIRNSSIPFYHINN